MSCGGRWPTSRWAGAAVTSCATWRNAPARPSLARLAAALRISDRLGVPLAAALRRQAERARAEQARRVQERAAVAAPKILLVVVFVLVPAALLPVMTALALTALDAVNGIGW